MTIHTNRPARACSPWLSRWVSLQAYGLLARTAFRATSSPVAMRERFERFASRDRASLQRRFPRLQFEDHRIGRLMIESVRATPAPACVVLHLHGGAFIFGSAASYRQRALRLSYRCDAEVFVPEYRLAPEHPFPAALEDALVAYQYVRALRPHHPIIVSGDSAGGGLALSLLVRLRELAELMPRGAILLSPWTDLSVSGASVERNRGRDLWLSRAHLQQWARHYAAGADVQHPHLSPVFADLHALPALLLLAGAHEVLLDDAQRVAQRVRALGARAQLHIGPGMQHDWPLTLPWLRESRAAWQVMSDFVAACCNERAPPTAEYDARIAQPRYSESLSTEEESIR